MTNLDQVYSFKVRAFQAFEGVLRAKGKIRTLIEYVPVDYVLDGYRLILSDKILDTARAIQEVQVERVLMLKNFLNKEGVSAPLDSDFLLFEHFLKSNELIQIYIKDESFALLGKVNSVNRASFNLKLLSSEGEWLDIHNFSFRKVKVIEIGTDYIKSLQLLNEFNQL